MNSKNNGKIAIGILVMFVVALSIIGVTYAYFTAQFSDNDIDSVELTAGELVATFNGTNNISVKNVVPGWISDGLHYYDSLEAETHDGKIYASKSTWSTTNGGELVVSRATTNMGIATPIQFTVTNTSNAQPDEAINYIIRLNIDNNGIYDAYKALLEKEEGLAEGQELSEEEATLKANYYDDLDNLYVSLYRGSFVQADAMTAYGTATPYPESYGAGATLIGGPYVLGNSGTTQILVNAPEVLSNIDDSNNYFVVFKYVNNTSAIQSAQLKTIKANVDIIGVQEGNDTKKTESTTDAVWYDADNVVVNFPAKIDETSTPTLTERLQDTSPVRKD